MKSFFYLLNKYFLNLLNDNIYYNILFFINCIRLNKKFYYLNLFNPRTFNEKVLTLKTDKIEMKALFADKLQLKNEILNLGFEVNFPKIIQIFNNEAELLNFDFNHIRDKGFIIKANHGSGMNMIYHIGSLPTNKELIQIANWFKYDSSVIGREKHYSLINKKVFIEEILDFNIKDYKFHIFHGMVKFIQVDLDRFIGHKRNIYDIHWNLQSFDINYPKSVILIEKPINLKEMIYLAEQISAPYIFGSYVRVDFYVNNNLIYLGEITFHPGGGVEPFDSYESDLYMGSFFKI